MDHEGEIIQMRIRNILLLALVTCVAVQPACERPNSDAEEAEPSSESADSPEVESTATSSCEGVEDCLSVRVEAGASGDLNDGAVVLSGDDWSANPTGSPGVSLSREQVFPPYTWVANNSANSVSRVNTETGQEEARYWVGANPSRTAVDLDGNVWIGGRDDGRLTKILWDRSQCPDRNEDGVVVTATQTQMGPLNSSSDPYADECVVYSEIVQPGMRSIRGIAAGPDGRVWIGHSYGGVQSIEPNTFVVSSHIVPNNVPRYSRGEDGVFRQELLEPDGAPAVEAYLQGIYGLVVDREGMLYASSYSRNTLPRFNTFTNTWEAVYVNTGCQNYGIALDGRDRVWLGCTDGDGGVMMFDPATNASHRFALRDVQPTDTVVRARVDVPAMGNDYQRGVTGLAVEPETGDVWASIYARGITARLRLNEGDLTESYWTLIRTAPGMDLRGVGFDHDGFAWTHGVSSDKVWKIDPTTNQLVEGFEEGVSVGVGSHYTYSDFTGSTGLSFTAPRGLWTFVVEPAEGAAGPRSLSWDAFVPTGAAAEIRVRPMNTDGLSHGAWFPAVTETGTPRYHAISGSRDEPLDLSTLGWPSQSIQIEVRLSATTGTRPIIGWVELQWESQNAS